MKVTVPFFPPPFPCTWQCDQKVLPDFNSPLQKTYLWISLMVIFVWKEKIPIIPHLSIPPPCVCPHGCVIQKILQIWIHHPKNLPLDIPHDDIAKKNILIPPYPPRMPQWGVDLKDLSTIKFCTQKLWGPYTICTIGPIPKVWDWQSPLSKVMSSLCLHFTSNTIKSIL